MANKKKKKEPHRGRTDGKKKMKPQEDGTWRLIQLGGPAGRSINLSINEKKNQENTRRRIFPSNETVK